MKTIVTTLISILFVVFVTAQQNSNNNELHAFYKERNLYVLPQNYDQSGSFYTNINLTDESTPQNEPSVRISRVNPDIVVAAWRDFRMGWQEPDVVRRIGYAYSHDGGLTWSESQLLPDPLPDHLSQSDPVVTSDSEGNFYISSTSRQPVQNYNREMLIYKSTNNGETFSLQTAAVPGSGLQGEDKEWIFYDPVETNPTYDNIFIIWRSFGPSQGIKFRKSADFGNTWSSTVHVSDVGSGQGANVASGVNGEIYAVWLNGAIMFDISYDGGESFGLDKVIDYINDNDYYSFPYISVDYSHHDTRGNVYVVWADDKTGNEDIWFQRSDNGGESWLQNPIRVNDATTNDQYWPMIMCDTSGIIAVIYYDEREQVGLMNAYLAISEDAGSTWINHKLSDSPFFGFTPNSNVRFGDYIGVDMFAGKIIPVWTDDRTFSGYNQEIYTAVVDINTGMTDPEYSKEEFITNLNSFPNPFQNKTEISFNLVGKSRVTVNITNTLGELVEKLSSEKMEEGFHRFIWDAGSRPDGLYFLNILTENRIFTRKLLLSR